MQFRDIASGGLSLDFGFDPVSPPQIGGEQIIRRRNPTPKRRAGAGWAVLTINSGTAVANLAAQTPHPPAVASATMTIGTPRRVSYREWAGPGVAGPTLTVPGPRLLRRAADLPATDRAALHCRLG